jgi:nucleoside-diphosphate-sugar epimerase
LLDEGISVVATGRQAQKLEDLRDQGAQTLVLDLAKATPFELRRALTGVDCVWHCAALSAPWGHPEDFFAANVLATRNVLRAAQELGVRRFVHVSTPALYFDFQHRLNVTEAFRPARFVNHYARTKFEAEQAVQHAVTEGGGAMTAVMLRPRALFGPGDQVLVPRMLRVAQERGGKLPLPRGGRTWLDLTYLDNVVHAMSLASTATGLAPCEVFNISNDEPVVLADVLNTLFQGLAARKGGDRLQIKSVPYPVVAAAARLMELTSRWTHREPALTAYSVGALAFSMTLDIRAAREKLGYVPKVDMAEGLRRTIDALAAQGA